MLNTAVVAASFGFIKIKNLWVCSVHSYVWFVYNQFLNPSLHNVQK